MRSLRPVLAGLCLVGLLGCSSSSPGPELDVATATRQVTAGLFLDDAQAACVTTALATDGTRVALNTRTKASKADQRRFVDAVKGCVPPENLAEAYVNVIRSAAPTATDDQLGCARTTLIGLEGDDLAVAYIVAVSPSAPDPLDTATLLDRFTEGCGLGDLLAGTPAPAPADATTVPDRP